MAHQPRRCALVSVEVGVQEARTSRSAVGGGPASSPNRLDAVYEVTTKTWLAERQDGDERLSPEGRVMEMLSETTLQGWL